MGFKIEIDFRKGHQQLRNLIRYIDDDKLFFEAQAAVYDLAYKTADDMKNIINNERHNPKRPDDALVNNIAVEPINTTAGVEMGIGNITRLNLLAPHWELINDGGTYKTVETHVVPTDYFGDPGVGFVTFKAGSLHTITGIDYVGRSIRNLDKELRVEMEKLGAKFVSGASNASK